ncbi:hypothetical protein ASE93_15715 [Serratia sp. Leaf50]|uniref:hypothetical protein n=1 Tax=Rouxiella sp. S1S-2 TaxID=2653856 RepID=UPI0006F9A0F8|nr:hypothetical protein [Rouxiella sp. S1S-2]KAB7895542.1 hypothetical protein GA565_05840 [Rouxiella sp. S1S-2]KQN44087.1 hypothetical protein ASE93_15715 [Serratia sp. Leaf50]
MKFSMLLLPVLVCTTLLTGCINHTAPIRNVSEAISTTHTSEQVKKAILVAGAQRGWQMTAPQNGLILATLTPRNHVAKVKITYTAINYNIQYVSSENLNAEGGKIHKNYNRWVANLDQDIKAQLNVVDQR